MTKYCPECAQTYQDFCAPCLLSRIETLESEVSKLKATQPKRKRKKPDMTGVTGFKKGK